MNNLQMDCMEISRIFYAVPTEAFLFLYANCIGVDSTTKYVFFLQKPFLIFFLHYKLTFQ